MDINRIDQLLNCVYKCDREAPEYLSEKIVSKASQAQKAVYSNRRLAVALTSFCLLVMSLFVFGQSNAAAHIYGSFMEWYSYTFGIDIDSVDGEFLQTRMLGEYEMSITRLVFSEHELFVSYSINTTEITNDDILWFVLKDGNRIISRSSGTYNLFSECLSEQYGKNSLMHFEGGYDNKGEVFEGYHVWRGIDLNYENQSIKLEFSYYDWDKEKIESCVFDIVLTMEYKYTERIAPLDYKHYENGAVYHCNTIVSTYSGLLVIGTGNDIPRNLSCTITDSSGNELQPGLLSGYGSDRFIYHFTRKHPDHCQPYTISFYDTKEQVRESHQTVVSF